MIIALFGLRSAGKSTIASALYTHIEEATDYEPWVDCFACDIRRDLITIYGVENAWGDKRAPAQPLWYRRPGTRYGLYHQPTELHPKPLTLREMLISVGQARREEEPDHWVRRLAQRQDLYHRDDVATIIDDARMPNELAWLRKKNAKLTFIRDLSQVDSPSPTEEPEKMNWLFNKNPANFPGRVVEYDKTAEDLIATVRTLASDLDPLPCTESLR